MKKPTAIRLLIIAGIALLATGGYFVFGRKNTVTRSFYCWKNNFSLSNNEIALLDEMQVQKVYFKLMDVDWDKDGGVHPVVRPQVANMAGMKNKNIVPVLFITNRTVQKIAATAIPKLAQNLWQQVQTHVLPHYKITEIQLDCDWNETSRGNFFALVEEMKRITQLQISATIRLYQFKHAAKAGVPPAHRGMLMFYNMGSFKEPTAANSIFDYKTAKEYMDDAQQYPLPLDVALPAFGWCVLYRNNTFLALVDELDGSSVAQLNYVKPLQPNVYTVTADTVLQRATAFGDIYLRRGDIIKVEETDAATLYQAAKLVGKATNNRNFSVSFFDFDKETINTLTPAAYEKAFNSFK